jgi:hypothetical protein
LLVSRAVRILGGRGCACTALLLGHARVHQALATGNRSLELEVALHLLIARRQAAALAGSAHHHLAQVHLFAQMLGRTPLGSLYPELLGLLSHHLGELHRSVETDGALFQRPTHRGQAAQLSRQHSLGPERRAGHAEPFAGVLGLGREAEPEPALHLVQLVCQLADAQIRLCEQLCQLADPAVELAD